jgi:hypothetical protein
MTRFIIIFLFFSIITASSAVYRVGDGKRYKKPSDVMSLVQDGDTVEIDAGLYDGDAGIWRKNNLYIRGIGGYVHLKAAANLPQGKAIWIVQGNNNIIEYIKFTDAKVRDKNGAGIRFEGTNLTVRHCQFFDNEDGILAGANPNSTIRIEFCEFGHNGYGDGYSHNLYIGTIKKFIFLYNYTHHAKVGHCIKSRAQENIIMYNRIMDEIHGFSSYLINLPNGGLSYIACNLLMQSSHTQNSKMIDYGSEGYKNSINNIYIYNNTLVNKRKPGIFVGIKNGAGEVKIINNIFAGFSADAANAIPSFADTSNNAHETDISKLDFADEKNYNYHILSDSPVIDRGKNGLTIPGYPDYLQFEYRHPADSVRIVYDGIADIGACQYEKPETYIEKNRIKNMHSYLLNGYLFISVDRVLSQNPEIKIFSIRGEMIRNGCTENYSGNLVFNVESLPAGVFFYIVRYSGKVLKGSFIKN